MENRSEVLPSKSPPAAVVEQVNSSCHFGCRRYVETRQFVDIAFDAAQEGSEDLELHSMKEDFRNSRGILGLAANRSAWASYASQIVVIASSSPLII